MYFGNGLRANGLYIAMADGYYYACQIGEEEADIEAYPHVFYVNATTARMILQSSWDSYQLYEYAMLHRPRPIWNPTVTTDGKCDVDNERYIRTGI